MSWDISIQDIPKDAKDIEDIPDDFVPQPLGKRSDLIEKIKEIVPEVDFTDPSWGIIHNENISIEFNMGKEEVCESIMLHVRSGGNTVFLIQHLLQEMGLRAFDCQEGGFFEVDKAMGSFNEWKEFRNRVIDQYKK